jgi:hypothetical protein
VMFITFFSAPAATHIYSASGLSSSLWRTRSECDFEHAPGSYQQKRPGRSQERARNAQRTCWKFHLTAAAGKNGFSPDPISRVVVSRGVKQ